MAEKIYINDLNNENQDRPASENDYEDRQNSENTRRNAVHIIKPDKTIDISDVLKASKDEEDERYVGNPINIRSTSGSEHAFTATDDFLFDYLMTLIKETLSNHDEKHRDVHQLEDRKREFVNVLPFMPSIEEYKRMMKAKTDNLYLCKEYDNKRESLDVSSWRNRKPNSGHENSPYELLKCLHLNVIPSRVFEEAVLQTRRLYFIYVPNRSGLFALAIPVYEDWYRRKPFGLEEDDKYE
ncbi:hypothetical protein DPMN_051060 [Dreissena polymorpha]|uniref:Uncharacterized protein n=1 Tax=Dreissena polymorpha TaxID=45954 RepID=A0A9D4CJ28_DREPO|nr:hypothetical protein DPMN_051060 [Dreissena polymorpha]